jgi:hypothetical protein
MGSAEVLNPGIKRKAGFEAAHLVVTAAILIIADGAERARRSMA